MIFKNINKVVVAAVAVLASEAKAAMEVLVARDRGSVAKAAVEMTVRQQRQFDGEDYSRQWKRQ